MAIRDTETLDKLYLEWSQFTNAKTVREHALERVVDNYGLALRMIEHGVPNPDRTAANALSRASVDLARAGKKS